MLTKIAVFSSQTSAPELPLGGFLPSDDPVHVKNIEGLGPVKADITTSQFASSRGMLYQGSSVGARNIVLSLGLNPDWATQTMSTLRQYLYAYFMPEQWVKLRFFSDHLPDVDIEGYVESFDPNMFSQDPEIAISIICPQPDFIEADAHIFTGTTDDGSATTVFDYTGSVNTGLELKIERTIATPSYTGGLTVDLDNDLGLQIFNVIPVTINTSKYLKLSTVQNAKRIQEIAYADGAINNKLPQMNLTSVWMQIVPGINTFYLSTAAPGYGLDWTMAYFNRYGGL